MLRLALLVSLLLLLAACSSQAALTVDLKSDLAPGVEIAVARTTVTTGGRVVGMTSLDVVGTDLVRGARVGEVVGLAAGDYLVEVDALRPDGTLAAARRVSLSLQGNYAVTVVISRDCAHQTCPGAHDDGTATECYHGRCVPPSCADGTATCGTPGCTVASDCTAPPAACAHAECLDHECWTVATPATCSASEVCDPASGCAVVAHADAGTTMDGGAHDLGVTPDAGAPDTGSCGSCDDGNGCTDDTCVAGSCHHANNSNGCDDGNACTHSDACSGGSCGGVGYSCDPPPCMSASCDGSGGCSIGGGCGAGTECSGGSCVACGGADQTCCGGSGCNAGLWCYTGVCTCAQPGGPCCPWDSSCAGGSTCEAGRCCMPIGASSSAGPCCAGLHNVSGICFG